MPEATDLRAWLDEHQARYVQEPSEAESLLEEVQTQLAQLPGQAPSALGVELTLFAADLAWERRELVGIRPALSLALRWCEGGTAPQHLLRLLNMHARADIQALQFSQAASLLERALSLSKTLGDPIESAITLTTLALFANRQGNSAQAQAHSSEALALFKHSGYQGPWAQIYASLAVARRELGDRPGRRAILQEGVEVCQAQRRWGEAANLVTGLIDMALEDGDTAAAEPWLALGQQLAERATPNPSSLGQSMMQAARARWLAAKGQLHAACDLMRQTIAASEHRVISAETAVRLDQLALWLARLGEGADAVQASRRAHGLRIEISRAAEQRELMLWRQRMELEHANAERQRSDSHAQALAHKNAALEQTLALQRELQAELIEASKLASLGSLLAGVAHELNTPLGSALTALSTCAALSTELEAQLASGAVSRSALLQRLAAQQAAAELAQRNLQRAFGLVGSYRELHTQSDQEPLQKLRLDTLLRAAWERAISPGSPLRLQLELDAGASLPVQGEVLTEVLLQLFQNIERHAYPPGADGLARVAVKQAQGQVLLEVSDQGRGIAPELLPRIFDPYVSSQFGRGRSGLGLFVAQAAVRQRLGGQLRVRSEPGHGSCFEISWPTGSEGRG